MTRNIVKLPNIIRFCMNPSILFFICLLISSPVFSGEPDEKLHTKCIYPTVKVNSTINSASSTGAIIRSEKIKNREYHNVVITTAHGFIGSKFVIEVFNYVNWSEIENISIYTGSVYYIESSIDLLVIIFISDRKMPTVELGFREKLFIGNKIIRVGCGLGDSPRLEEGIITSVKIEEWFACKGLIRMSVYTLFGDSGGPVFHNYKLVGFTKAIRKGRNLKEYYHYALAITLDSLSKLVKNEEDRLDFVLDTSEKLPVFEFFKLKIDTLGKNLSPIPANPWIDN